MVGPVFFQEVILGSRRSKQRIFRWIYAGWLLLELFGITFFSAMMVTFRASDDSDIYLTKVVCDWFVPMFVKQHFVLLLLATPVITAGAITDEKSSGTLQYLLTTDLNSFYIVVGKLLGRLVQVGILFLTGLPLFCFFGALYGIEPFGLLAMCLVTLLWMLLIGSASLFASVWCRQTRDAVLGVLVAFGAICLLDWLTFNLLANLNPIEVLGSAWWAHTVSADFVSFAYRLLWLIFVWGSVSVVCLALAVWRLRPAYIRQLEGLSRRRKQRWWHARRPEISEEPVRWKERHVHGLAPFNLLRRTPRWAAILAIFLTTTAIACAILWFNWPPGITLAGLPAYLANPDPSPSSSDATGVSNGGEKGNPRAGMGGNAQQKVGTNNRSPKAAGMEHSSALESPTARTVRVLLIGIVPCEEGFSYMGMGALLLASLITGIRCSGSISGEREKQTWEALLLTPLSERQLVRAKLSGIMGASYIYFLAYAIPALLLSLLGGIPAVFWTVLLLAVTWLAMRFMGAAGIWCSGRSKSSWRSLLGTVAFGYVGGFFLISLVLSPFIFLLTLIIMILLTVLQTLSGISLGVGWGAVWAAVFISVSLTLAGVFYGLGWYFMIDAEKRVANVERTRHWKYEPSFVRTQHLAEQRPYYR